MILTARASLSFIDLPDGWFQFDPAQGMATLVTTQVSKANAKQRQGRAGSSCHLNSVCAVCWLLCVVCCVVCYVCVV